MADYIVSDTSLTAVADAIRSKTGGTSQIEFPNGFVNEIGTILGDDLLEKTNNKTLTTYSSDKITTVRRYMFYQNSNLKHIDLPNCTTITVSAFNESGVETYNLPKLTNIQNSGFRACKIVTAYFPLVTNFEQSAFDVCTTIVTAVLPKVGLSSKCFYGCTSLKTIDLTNANTIAASACQNSSVLDTLILRRGTQLTTLANVSAFSGTPFASGGTGGTIYIPKVLYDELGTGSTLDYKAATNWSTVDAYGTITWAQIEGSQYETAYADGTPIPTT